jgi:hypothetical protein
MSVFLLESLSQMMFFDSAAKGTFSFVAAPIYAQERERALLLQEAGKPNAARMLYGWIDESCIEAS